MKNIKFLLGLLSVVFIMASCATTQSAMNDDMDDPRTQQIGNRLYLQDPFYGPVVLERDPYTGRYFDVTMGSRFGGGFYGGYPVGGYYRGGGVGRAVPNRSNGAIIRQQPVRQQQQVPQNREETRRKVLGNN